MSYTLSVPNGITLFIPVLIYFLSNHFHGKLFLDKPLAESLLTDLPKRAAEAVGAAVKHTAEERIVADLLADLPRGERYVALWQEYDAATTPEARLVKDVDKLEMVLQSVRYSERGHINLQEFRAGHAWFYAISRTLFGEMTAEFPL